MAAVADLRPGVHVVHKDGTRGVVTFSYFYGWGLRSARSVEVTFYNSDGRARLQCRAKNLRII